MGLLLWARRPGVIDRLLHGRAHSSNDEQCRAGSSRRKLNTDLQLIVLSASHYGRQEFDIILLNLIIAVCAEELQLLPGL